jgi:hypothetical protein
MRSQIPDALISFVSFALKSKSKKKLNEMAQNVCSDNQAISKPSRLCCRHRLAMICWFASNWPAVQNALRTRERTDSKESESLGCQVVQPFPRLAPTDGGILVTFGESASLVFGNYDPTSSW